MIEKSSISASTCFMFSNEYGDLKSNKKHLWAKRVVIGLRAAKLADACTSFNPHHNKTKVEQHAKHGCCLSSFGDFCTAAENSCFGNKSYQKLIVLIRTLALILFIYLIFKAENRME